MSSGDSRKKKDEKKKNNSILTYLALKNFMWIFYVSVDLIKKLAPSEFFFLSSPCSSFGFGTTGETHDVCNFGDTGVMHLPGVFLQVVSYSN